MLCSCGKMEKNLTLGKEGKATSGVWITFSEINNMLSSQNGFQKELAATIENCKQLNIENVYIHVRSYCDSLFKSEYFPLTEKAKGYDYDIFSAFLDAFHNENIKVHAWINPYRVLTSSTDVKKLNTESAAYKWLNDAESENDTNVCFANGIYLNPSSVEVQRLVIDGVREILELYEVDGIHIDDYFYPTTDPDFDKKSYEEYCRNANTPLELSSWRRANVDALVSGIYNAVKFKNDKVVFSVSPAASIEKNYNELYADVKGWIEEGYIDCIIPQLYFGFEYPEENFRFKTLLKEWKSLVEANAEVELIIGLAMYKTGTTDTPDSVEWLARNDIIARQAEICYEDGYVGGYILFSYTSLFSSEERNIEQRKNLYKTMERYKTRVNYG